VDNKRYQEQKVSDTKGIGNKSYRGTKGIGFRQKVLYFSVVFFSPISRGRGLSYLGFG
jgi:hypothetical protein